ncbi:hypothetical protein DIPPA_34853 [Diplonema papillatum]|nr:hypothetical protein DIPPA_34853 [Diplonema papillatum]
MISGGAWARGLRSYAGPLSVLPQEREAYIDHAARVLQSRRTPTPAGSLRAKSGAREASLSSKRSAPDSEPPGRRRASAASTVQLHRQAASQHTTSPREDPPRSGSPGPRAGSSASRSGSRPPPAGGGDEAMLPPSPQSPGNPFSFRFAFGASTPAVPGYLPELSDLAVLDGQGQTTPVFAPAAPAGFEGVSSATTEPSFRDDGLDPEAYRRRMTVDTAAGGAGTGTPGTPSDVVQAVLHGIMHSGSERRAPDVSEASPFPSPAASPQLAPASEARDPRFRRPSVQSRPSERRHALDDRQDSLRRAVEADEDASFRALVHAHGPTRPATPKGGFAPLAAAVNPFSSHDTWRSSKSPRTPSGSPDGFFSSPSKRESRVGSSPGAVHAGEQQGVGAETPHDPSFVPAPAPGSAWTPPQKPQQHSEASQQYELRLGPTSRHWNLHSGPDTRSDVLASMTDGAKIGATEEKPGWLKLTSADAWTPKFAGGFGWHLVSDGAAGPAGRYVLNARGASPLRTATPKKAAAAYSGGGGGARSPAGTGQLFAPEAGGRPFPRGAGDEPRNVATEACSPMLPLPAFSPGHPPARAPEGVLSASSSQQRPGARPPPPTELFSGPLRPQQQPELLSSDSQRNHHHRRHHHPPHDDDHRSPPTEVRSGPLRPQQHAPSPQRQPLPAESFSGHPPPHRHHDHQHQQQQLLLLQRDPPRRPATAMGTPSAEDDAGRRPQNTPQHTHRDARHPHHPPPPPTEVLSGSLRPAPAPRAPADGLFSGSLRPPPPPTSASLGPFANAGHASRGGLSDEAGRSSTGAAAWEYERKHTSQPGQSLLASPGAEGGCDAVGEDAAMRVLRDAEREYWQATAAERDIESNIRLSYVETLLYNTRAAMAGLETRLMRHDQLRPVRVLDEVDVNVTANGGRPLSKPKHRKGGGKPWSEASTAASGAGRASEQSHESGLAAARRALALAGMLRRARDDGPSDVADTALAYCTGPLRRPAPDGGDAGGEGEDPPLRRSSAAVSRGSGAPSVAQPKGSFPASSHMSAASRSLSPAPSPTSRDGHRSFASRTTHKSAAPATLVVTTGRSVGPVSAAQDAAAGPSRSGTARTFDASRRSSAPASASAGAERRLGTPDSPLSPGSPAGSLQRMRVGPGAGRAPGSTSAADPAGGGSAPASLLQRQREFAAAQDDTTGGVSSLSDATRDGRTSTADVGPLQARPSEGNGGQGDDASEDQAPPPPCTPMIGGRDRPFFDKKKRVSFLDADGDAVDFSMDERNNVIVTVNGALLCRPSKITADPATATLELDDGAAVCPLPAATPEETTAIICQIASIVDLSTALHNLHHWEDLHDRWL